MNKSPDDMRYTGVLSGCNPSNNQIFTISLTQNPRKKPYISKGVLCSLSRKAHLYTSGKASFTIEAALVLPLFLFLMLTILYLFEVQLLQMQIREALYDLAQLQAQTAYAAQQDDDSVLSSVLDSGVSTVVSSLSIQSGIDSYLYDLVVGGKYGIVCTEDEDASADTVTALRADCIVKLPVSIFGTLRFSISETVSVRNWTGYDPSDTTQADYVYVTANGTVYHEDRNCTYLNLSIRTVSGSQLDSLRNSSGAKYAVCEICGEEAAASGIYYITTYGDAYHTSLSCSGLKRTVYLVLRSETTLPACSKCGSS